MTARCIYCLTPDISYDNKKGDDMTTSKLKTALAADLRQVWDLVTDVGRYPQWRSDLDRVEVLNRTVFMEYARDGAVTKFTVTRVDPYARWEFDMESSHMTGHWTGVFRQRGAGTVIDFTEQVTAKKLWMKPFCQAVFETAPDAVCGRPAQGAGKVTQICRSSASMTIWTTAFRRKSYGNTAPF